MVTLARWTITFAWVGALAFGCRTIPDGPCARGHPWREDVNVAAAALRTQHPNREAARRITSADGGMQATCAAVSIAGGVEAKMAIARLVAKLKDPHSVADLRGGRPQTTRYPVRFFWFSDGLFIVAARPEHRRLLGARVISVGGVPIEAAGARLTELVAWSTTGWRRRWAAGLLATPELLTGLGLADAHGVATFGLEGAGSTQTVRLRRDLAEWSWPEGVDHVLGQAANPGPLPFLMAAIAVSRYLQRSDLALWHERLHGGRVLYVRHNAVRNRQVDLEDAIDELRETLIDTGQVDALIYDLRLNQGGNFNLAQHAVRRLIGSRIDAPGRLFVLVDEGTFSAAIYLAHILRYDTPHARFIGQPVGDRLIAYEDADPVVLPHSGMPIYVSNSYPLYPERRGEALSIDRVVPYTYDDYAQGRDPVLDAALKAHLRQTAPGTKQP